MVLPIGDAPNPRGLPLVTYVLIAINVAVFILLTVPLSGARPDLGDPAVADYLRTIVPALGGQVPIDQIIEHLTSYDIFVFAHGFRPAAPALGALFASLFLHAGFAHLFGNMLFLWIYGDNVEHRLGPGRYVVAYLGTGVMASLTHAILASGSAIPTIGASGAISGVLGCYFIWFPHNRVRLLWLFPPLFMKVFLVPARIVLGLYLVAENLLPLLVTSTAAGGVAHGAHIGGFVAGLGLAWGVDRWTLVTRPPEYADVRRAANGGGDGATTPAVGTLLDGGRMEEAARRYFAIPAAHAQRVLEPADGLRLARWLRDNGHGAAALTILRRLLRDFPRDSERAAIHLAAGVVLLRDLEEPTAAYQHFLDALDLDPDPEIARLARQGIVAVDALQKRPWGRPRPTRRD